MRDYYNGTDDLIAKSVAVVVSIALLIGFCVFIGKINHSSNDVKWNNGICPKDNTPWKYRNSARDGYWRYDYYTCDNGHVIELVNDYEAR